MSAPRLSILLVLAPSLVIAQAASPAAAPAAPESHTVQRGDTLWDLSAKYLDSPWYWPKVWSYNPQIQNPHWIYPGNVVRLRPGGNDDTPAAAEAAEEPDDDGAAAEPVRELEGLSRADMTSAPRSGQGDDVTVGGPYRIGKVAGRALPVRRESFVTQRQIERSGTITAAFEDKLLLTTYDRAYARFADLSKVEPGQTLVLYRPDRAIRHPVSGALFGWKSTIVGAARVVSVDPKVATIEITQAADSIERGTLVGPWTEATQYRVTPRPNERRMTGYIIAAQQDLVSTVGEHHVVFVDRGRADGVEEGNVFTVIRAGDPYGHDTAEMVRQTSGSEALPIEDIGHLLVLDVQDRSSAAMVVRSQRELYVGDKVEMRSRTGER